MTLTAITIVHVAVSLVALAAASRVAPRLAPRGTSRGWSRRKVGKPEDIAPAVVFLASSDSRWMTGESVVISGGLR